MGVCLCSLSWEGITLFFKLMIYPCYSQDVLTSDPFVLLELAFPVDASILGGIT